MTLDPNAHLLVTDTETTGLDPESSHLIEVGFMVVTLDLQLVDQIEIVCKPDRPIDWSKVSPVVQEMHEKSGLRKILGNGAAPVSDYEEAEWDLIEWYEGLFGTAKMPLMGSTVQFDRKFLEAYFVDLVDRFHYRNIDISSVKELCSRYNPDVYAKSPPKQERHRVGPDMIDTVHEAEFYLKNFLFTTTGV